jgi:hypothetical protein
MARLLQSLFTPILEVQLSYRLYKSDLIVLSNTTMQKRYQIQTKLFYGKGKLSLYVQGLQAWTNIQNIPTTRTETTEQGPKIESALLQRVRKVLYPKIGHEEAHYPEGKSKGKVVPVLNYVTPHEEVSDP